MNRYSTVVAALPPLLPALNRVEAARIATKIRFKFWPATSFGVIHRSKYPERNVRRCWISTRPTNRANAYKGLGRLIHDLSHQCFAAHYPTRRAHDPLHAYYETQIAAYVAASGWMKRMTDPPKAKVKVAALRLQEAAKTEAAIKRWEGKRRRAETALRKYRRKLKRLSRPTASA